MASVARVRAVLRTHDAAAVAPPPPARYPARMDDAASVRIEAAALHAFLVRLYGALGLAPDDAADCAAQAVDAELRGVRSHGCVRVGGFVERLRRGTIDPRPATTTVVDLPGWTLLDGGRGMAAPVGRRAMDVAMEKAARQGIGAAGVRRVSHTGHVAWFAARALERGMIGIVASSAAPNLAPWGGAERLVGNNPIAFAVPAREATPVVLDMATSRVARGHVLLAARTGRTIPEGWALDAEGRPTTDPQRALAGTMLPLGEHKGAALALVLGLLTDALTGNAPDVDRPDWLASDREFLLSLLLVAIDPARCLDGDYAAAVDAVAARLKASRLAPGADEIRLPGERAARHAAAARADGIRLAAPLADELDALAAAVGVPALRPPLAPGGPGR